ncbi:MULTISPECIES: LPS assembly lipoprotein LptE [Thermodesulfovibrio]|uniref:Lipoprotein, putative n=2 Tax=Thermodesulfovibrio yellowstonii TaxID=28262 RepID=B5YLB3_THEYD|nr:MULTISPECIES: LPS assembly lipoprotein LptE [Thermodesulfovibrio]ACI21213.1 lipoprotein, putative [Thermodesulfovibrio yellowstonii DSM 11347]GLI53768.1 lipoprotein [Thermodesulfovibrio islandicus]
MKKIFITALLFLNLLTLSCGYTIHTKADLPFQEIYLRKVDNLTLEPGLQDKMRKIAYQALVDNGFTITSSADRVLDIQIKNYRLVTLSEIGLNTVEYQIIIDVKAILYEGKEIKKEFAPASPFTTFFRTTRDLQSIIADRDLAIESLIRDICDDMVRKLIFETEENKKEENLQEIQ